MVLRAGLLFAVLFLWASYTLAQPMAYVPGSDNTIRVIDTSTNMVDATIPLIGQARGAVVTPDGTKVYAPIGGADRVAVIQTSTNTVLTNITVGDNPSDVAISPDGTTAWVAHFSGTNNPDIVTRIDTATDTVVTTVSVGNCPPREILTTPADGDGDYFVYVNGGLTCGDVFRIDPATNMRIGPTFDFTSTSIFNRPTSMDITPDGSKIYVGISNNVANTNFIEIIDIAADGTPSLDPMPISINDAVPDDIAAAPVGNNVWVMVNPGTFPLNCIFILINRTDNSFVCITGSAMLPNPFFSNVGFLRDGSSYYGSTINLGGSVQEVDNGLPITYLGDPIDISVAPFLRSPYFIGPDTALLTVNLTGDGEGTVTADPAGIDCGDTCEARYPIGTDASEVTLTATPDANSVFIGWGGDCSGTDMDTTITITDDTVCEAEFMGVIFSLTAAINATGTSAGTVSSNPSGISCPGDCSEDYDRDTMVQLTAAPDAISQFINWTDDCSGTNPTTTINMVMDSLCTANFALADFNLDVAIGGPGGGTIMSTPGDINCPGVCSNIFQATTNVALLAEPDEDSVFQDWSDGCSGTDPMTNIEVLSNSLCTANFELKRFDVIIDLEGNGPGTVTSVPAGINCPNDCSQDFVIRTFVNLIATPDPISDFIGWSGDPDCEDGIIQELTQDTTCIPTFNLKQFTLNVGRIGDGDGTVRSDPEGINCGDDCSEIYNINTVVTLTPTPQFVSKFVGWTGDPDCEDGVVTMNRDITCTAEFMSTAPPPLSADVSIVKTANPDPVEAGSELTYFFDVNNAGPNAATGVKLTDFLPEGVTFVSASQGCAIENEDLICSVDTLSVSETRTFSVVVIPEITGNLMNSATVKAATPDPNPANNTSTITTQVVGDVTAFLTVNSSVDTINTEPGAMFAIPVDISNPDIAQTNQVTTTKKTADGVVFTVDLPEGFDIEALTTTVGECNINTLQCEIGDIFPGEVVTVLVDAIASDEEGVFSVRFSASTSDGQVFDGNATVDVGGRVVVDGGGGGGCALSSVNSTNTEILGFFAPILLLTFALIMRRRMRVG